MKRVGHEDVYDRQKELKMEENYMAKTRNGHELKDMYNPETNTLDIRSNGLYPSNVLSNLCSNAFVFDGVECGSMGHRLRYRPGCSVHRR